LVSFSTPNFRRLTSRAEARESLKEKGGK
jgi:hypothetical protein